MGCCSSNIEYPISDPESFISREILKKLQSSDLQIISKFSRSNPNNVLIIYENMQLSALAISILTSNLNLMKNLHLTYSASFSVLQEQLRQQHIDLMSVMIKHFNPSIIKYYIPIYLESQSTKDQDFGDFEPYSCTTLKSGRKIHPVRFAAENEYLEFIKFIVAYYKGQTPPDCFNVHSIDEETGENCALIACRVGSLPLVEYLNKIGCNFKLINKNNETAINLAVAQKKTSKNGRRVSVLPYLIEEVQLDISINFEETLIMCRTPGITEYIKEKLADKGIVVGKSEIEDQYKKRETEISDHLTSGLDLNIPEFLCDDSQESPIKIRKTVSFLSSVSSLSSIS